MMFEAVERAIDAVKRGEFVVVVDDEDRENEGDLIIAAEKMTPDKMAFMIRYTSGVICLPLEGDRLDELQLPLMVSGNENTEGQRTAFTVSVDARIGTTTGISAADRCATVLALINESTTEPADLARPGHIFPLRYREGGVLKRAGHTEAAVDLARLAGGYPAGVLAEIVNDDGTMQRRPELEAFATEHGLVLVTIADLIRFRRHTRSWCGECPRRASRRSTATSPRTSSSRCSTTPSTSRSCGARSRARRTCSSACTANASPATCSDRCVATAACSSTARSRRSPKKVKASSCTCAGTKVGASGSGTSCARTRCRTRAATPSRRTSSSGFPVDSREYGIGAQILVDLGVTTMRLMTNNPKKYGGIEGYGLEIVERVPVQIVPNAENIAYLRAKQNKLGHLLGLDPENDDRSKSSEGS